MNRLQTVMFTHNARSRSARALSKALGIKLISPMSTTWTAWEQADKVILNWGNHAVPFTLPKVINPGAKVKQAAFKTEFFTAMKAATDPPRIPEFTTQPQEAVEWAKSGAMVMARTLTNGSGGDGIVFYNESDLAEFLRAKLFTKYVKKIAEYRVHFAFGRQIDVQKKGLRHDVDKTTIDTRVQTHRNGYIFLRENINPPDDVLQQASRAYRASGLDFGAVDVIWNAHYGRAYVLELNTAPGLEGTTLDNYVHAFQEGVT